MIRLNGVARADAPLQPVLERAVVEQAGQVVGLGAQLHGLEDLRVLQGDGHLRREQLDELELVAGERVADAEPLDASARRWPRPGRAAGRR